MDRRSLLFLILITISFFGIRYYYDEKRAQSIEEWKASELSTEQPVKASQAETPVLFPVKEPENSQEKGEFYLLESPYQQLVISQKGGAIVEINLPFHSKEHPMSVVHPTYIDDELVQKKSDFAQFPLVQAKRWDKTVVSPTLGGAYPLLRRTANDPLSRDSGLLLFSRDSADTNRYQIVHFDQQKLVLEAKLPSQVIRKTYSFPKEASRYPYMINVDIEIVGAKKELSLSSGIPDDELISGAPASALKYRTQRGEKSEVVQIDLPTAEFRSTSLQPDWVATSNGFFALILDPISGTRPGLSFYKVANDEAPSRLHDLQAFKSLDLPGYRSQLPLDPEKGHLQARLYAGPLSDSLFSTIDKSSMEDGSSKPSNFKACISFHGWFSFISEPFAKFLYFIMDSCYKLVNSWTLSIILTTIVLRILMYPLTQWSQKSMLRMKDIAPEVKAIQERHKKDPRKAQIEIMTLYRERGVNPFSGCLPLLIQMPFLIGMFDLLKSTYELRGASWISGWIDDLSQPDRLFSFGFHIPFLGSYFHLLPILLAVVMWWQQRLSTPLPQNPANMTDSERQQRAMGTIMTVVMTVMFYHFPAGLNLYWLSSMLLSIGQQLWTNRQFAHTKDKKTIVVKRR